MRIAWQVEYYYKWNTETACATIDKPDEEDQKWFEENGYVCKEYDGAWAIVKKGDKFPTEEKMQAYKEKKEDQRAKEYLLLKEFGIRNKRI